MNTEKQRKSEVSNPENGTDINTGNLSIRAAKKVDAEYFNKLLGDVQELLKDVKTSFADDIIAERNI